MRRRPKGDKRVRTRAALFKPGATLAEIMRALADATLAALPDRQTAAPGRLTGMAYALKHQAMQARVHEITAASYGFGAEWLRAVAKDSELPMPPEDLVVVIHLRFTTL